MLQQIQLNIYIETMILILSNVLVCYTVKDAKVQEKLYLNNHKWYDLIPDLCSGVGMLASLTVLSVLITEITVYRTYFLQKNCIGQK